MTFYEIDGVVPVVDPTAFVHPQASLIGDVHVGPGCYVGPFASLRGDFGRIVLSEGSNVQDSCTVHTYPGAETFLGPASHVGHGAVLHGCRLDGDVLVGMNAVVMDGVVVGADSLIGAQSFVPAGLEIPASSLVVGNPARVVRKLDDDALAWKRNGALVYRDLARRSLTSLRACEPLPEAEPGRPSLPGQPGTVPLHERRGDQPATGSSTRSK